MNDSDKTRQKLVSSIRKTKEDAAADSDSSKPSAAQPARKPATKARRKATPQKSSTSRPAVSDDPYQGGRRVWPD